MGAAGPANYDGLQQHTSGGHSLTRGPKGGRGIDASPLLDCEMQQQHGKPRHHQAQVKGWPLIGRPSIGQTVRLAIVPHPSEPDMGIVLEHDLPIVAHRFRQ